jgi:hypothetical protein
VLTPFDDYTIHQTALPIAHAGGGHADHYDRFWFNGYTEDMYFAVALGTYPNRGVIDAAIGVVHDGVQRSVFASGRLPLDRTQTRIGPISVEVVEPLRVSRVVVDAPDHGIEADLTFTARTAAHEEPRQTLWADDRLVMDVTRMTQLGSWSGSLATGGATIAIDGPAPTYGTKDRSWGIRPIGQPAPAAPSARAPGIFFLWAPLNFADECLHYIVFEDARGVPWSMGAAILPVIGPDGPVYGPDLGAREVSVAHAIDWQPGLRRSRGATLSVNEHGGDPQTVTLEPQLTFRMRGAGYLHPQYSHGLWHGDELVAGEEHKVEDLDTLALDCLHVQQVMRATWGDRRGIGVLEQMVIGPHAPSGFTDYFDGAPQ